MPAGGCGRGWTFFVIGATLAALLMFPPSEGRPASPQPAVIPCPGIFASSPETLSTTPPPGITAPCPGVVLGTLLGGSRIDWAQDVAVDAALNIYVTGSTESNDFPVTPGAYDTFNTYDFDSFLAKFDASGRLVYSTFLGGHEADYGRSIALGPDGAVYVAGDTVSWDFPTTPDAYDSIFNGESDAFVAKFGPMGGVVYSTLIGGSSEDKAREIAVDSEGNAYVTGFTSSFDFPVSAGAFVAAGEGLDVYVARLGPEGGLDYAARFGGQGNDLGFAIALDAFGQAYVTGFTESLDFVVTSDANDARFGGLQDGFVLKLDAQGSAVLYSSYFGGAGGDFGHDIEVDGQGNVYVSGDTQSSDFPVTPTAFDTTYNGRMDAVVAKFLPDGRVAYSTFLGGEGPEEALALFVDPAGIAYLAGYTESSGFPTSFGAFDATFNGLPGAEARPDAFLAKLDLTGAVVYSTFLGGAVEFVEGFGGDTGFAVVVDATGNATIVGRATSRDFPTTVDAFDTTYNGRSDPFVTRIELVPEPNRPPVAYFDVSQSLEVPTRVLLSAARSADAEDVTKLLEVRWDWENDGRWDTEWSTVKDATREYVNPGLYTVHMEVRDTTGLMHSSTRQVDLSGVPRAPFVVHAAANVTEGDVPLVVRFHGSARGGRPPYAFAWNFGDGATSALAEPTHTYETPGTYAVGLAVADAEGRSAVTVLLVTVAKSAVVNAGGESSPWLSYGTLALAVTGAVLWVLLRTGRSSKHTRRR